MKRFLMAVLELSAGLLLGVLIALFIFGRR